MFAGGLPSRLMKSLSTLAKRSGRDRSKALAADARREFRVDELARAGGTTVRNLRAYQDRGLLPPPERRGRTGYYTNAHLARLRLIGALLNRGYSIANIGELLETWHSGGDLGALLGLESAITSPWSDEVPQYVSMQQLMKDFGRQLTPGSLARVISLGIIELDGTRVRVPSMRMLFAARELNEAGIPLDEMLSIVRMLRGNVERVANELVLLIVKHVFDPLGDGLPPAKEVPRLSELIWRLRPLVNMAVASEVARAMGDAAHRHMGDRLSYVVDHLHDKTRPPSKPVAKKALAAKIVRKRK